MKHPEILAPAGSFDSLIAAVQCGANAVYLGGKGMNARRNAGNFDAEELRRAVEYCHLRGVKVYQTINIVPDGAGVCSHPAGACFHPDEHPQPRGRTAL